MVVVIPYLTKAIKQVNSAFFNKQCFTMSMPAVLNIFRLAFAKAKRLRTAGVNFTNAFAFSTNVLAHYIWCKRCHLVSLTKFCPTLRVRTSRIYTKLSHCTFYVVCQKRSINQPEQKVIVKCRVNWLLVSLQSRYQLF